MQEKRELLLAFCDLSPHPALSQRERENPLNTLPPHAGCFALAKHLQRPRRETSNARRLLIFKHAGSAFIPALQTNFPFMSPSRNMRDTSSARRFTPNFTKTLRR